VTGLRHGLVVKGEQGMGQSRGRREKSVALVTEYGTLSNKSRAIQRDLTKHR
jgi:hypothetical protein